MRKVIICVYRRNVSRKAVLLFLKKEESMTLKDMHYISLIAEEKSITKAAARLFVAQPALSQCGIYQDGVGSNTDGGGTAFSGVCAQNAA